MFIIKTNIVHMYYNTVTGGMTTRSWNIIILLTFCIQICTNGLLYNISSSHCILTLISFLVFSPSLLTWACCSLFHPWNASLALSVQLHRTEHFSFCQAGFA